jgi:hypothetical protein
VKLAWTLEPAGQRAMHWHDRLTELGQQHACSSLTVTVTAIERAGQ